MKFRHEFQTGSYGRSASDEGWEIVEPEHITIWKSAIVLLNSRKLNLTDCTANIEADWTPILRKHDQHYSTMKRLHESVKSERELSRVLGGFPQRSAKVKITAELVDGPKRPKHSDANFAKFAAESYLHDCFLILNICAPGSCDFYRGTLERNGATTDLSLSNVYFELSLLGSFKNSWPKITSLLLSETVKWFDAVRPSASQIPQNPMEKALFALLHIAKLDMSPMIVIWLFYAFESLLQTRAGENFSALIQRLIQLLQLDEKQSKILKSEFRDLYNLRSSIVHGGFEIVHPMHNEAIDERVDEKYERISKATDYGMTALIAAIQSTIARGWRYPIFTETMGGALIK